MDTLNKDLCDALRDFMAERGITQAAVATHLGRSADYVSGRLGGRNALSTDIVIAVAQLARIPARALMADMMIRAAGSGHASSGA